MSVAGTVTVEFAAEVAKFNQQLKTVRDQLSTVDDSFSKVGATVRSTAAAFGITLGATALVSFVRNAVLAADAIGDMAERVGESVESISRLKFIAEQSDLAFESLEGGVKIFQRTISQAAAGNESAAQTFRSLGLSATDLIRIPLEERVAVISDAFQRIPDSADRARLAMELFGRSGDELVPLLNRGGDGIRALAKQAEESGVVLSTSAANGIDFFIKKMSSMISSFKTGAAEIFGTTVAVLAGVENETQRLGDLSRRYEFLNSQLSDFDRSQNTSQAQRVRAIGEEIQGLQRIIAEKQLQILIESQLRDIANLPIDVSNPEIFESDEARRARESLARERAAQQNAERLAEIESRRIDAAVQAEIQQQALQDQISGNILVETSNQEHLDRIRDQLIAHSEEMIRIKSTTEQALGEISRQFGVEQIAYEEIKNQTLLAMTLGLFSNVVGTNKKFAKIAQKIAIAETIWHTLAGMGRALKDFPFPKNIAVAGVIGAYGFAQVQKIKSTNVDSPSGGFSGGAAGGGAAGVGGSDATQDSINQSAGQRITEVRITGTLTDAAGRVLADLVSDQIQNRDVVLFTSTSRQAQELLPSPT